MPIQHPKKTVKNIAFPFAPETKNKTTVAIIGMIPHIQKGISITVCAKI